MKYLEQVWFFLFMPGREIAFLATVMMLSRKTMIGMTTRREQKNLSEEIEMAQKFDLQLTSGRCRKARQNVWAITRKLGGWDHRRL